MKTIVLLLLLAIVASLFTGLYFLAREKNDPTKLLTALKVRVGLSILLIVFLASAFSLGWIGP
jgi:hypothetical protein